ncbi:hypothetical protein IAU60_001180 [Kwoniella sp. DSM 27419]
MPIAVPVSSPDVARSLQGLKASREGHLGSPSQAPLPTEIAVRIATLLARDDCLRTVAALHQCSKALYFAVTPVLYDSIEIKPASDALLSLWGNDGVALDDLDEALHQAQTEGSIFHPRHSSLRRLATFRYVRRMVVHTFPGDGVSESSGSSLSAESCKAFPSLNAVVLRPNAVDQLRTWIPTSYDRPRLPPFLEALTRSSSPTKLCIQFRSLTAEYWEEHMEATSIGQYQLVNRLSSLKDAWPDLDTFTVHGIVHQVLPSLPGCKNVYHFSSHITGSITRPILHPPGPRATYLPGPQWSYRAWQLGTAVKGLFPSGVNAERVLQDTSWSFVNTDGHLLTKMVMDDDDDSGVGYTEALGLIKGAVRTGLPQDLPMREGFETKLVGRVFERITYVQDEDCTGCGASVHTTPTLSSIRDIP